LHNDTYNKYLCEIGLQTSRLQVISGSQNGGQPNGQPKPPMASLLTSSSITAAGLSPSIVDTVMITLLPTRLHWIRDDGADDPCDLCAHSPVRLQIGSDTLVSPEDGDFTVSAAAIYLLRTLHRDHTNEDRVSDQLFPCCGHAMYNTGDEDVLICGCPNGSDVSVIHDVDGTVRLTSAKGKSYVVPAIEWQRATHEFSKTVLDFYNHSLPKTPEDDIDIAGYAKMMDEWMRRMTQT